MRAVDHAPLGVVPHDRRATQTFQNADLNFLRPPGIKAIEAAAKSREVFAGQADDEVGVNVHAGVVAQPSQVVGQAIVILPTGNTRLDLRIQRLDPHLELKRARRELGDECPQRFRQPIGNHFKMNEQAGRVAVEKELKNPPTDLSGSSWKVRSTNLNCFAPRSSRR